MVPISVDMMTCVQRNMTLTKANLQSWPTKEPPLFQYLREIIFDVQRGEVKIDCIIAYCNAENKSGLSYHNIIHIR